MDQERNFGRRAYSTLDYQHPDYLNKVLVQQSTKSNASKIFGHNAMQFVDEKRFNQSSTKAIVTSESTKELSPCATQKGSISIKNLPESSALKVQKEIMRPSPTRV